MAHITFGTYMMSDFLSNFIQHPTQKMDYGYFNQFLGRKVYSPFFGTRTEHIIGVAAGLTLTDHASQAIFKSVTKKELSFAAFPKPFIAHTVGFISAGVALYVGVDAAVNPAHEGKRMEVFKGELYNTYVGSCTAWFEPYVAPAVAFVGLRTLAAGWFGSALLPATLAYSTVKGFGWSDWGNSGLNDCEKEMNQNSNSDFLGASPGVVSAGAVAVAAAGAVAAGRGAGAGASASTAALTASRAAAAAVK